MTRIYMSNKEIAAEIRTELKKELPEYKFSVTKDAHSITVALMAAQETPFATLECGKDGEYTHSGEYAQLNHYHIKNKCNGYNLTDKAVELFTKVNEISNRRNWDNSDIQTDYFNVNYYFNLDIGKWNKGFEII